MGEGGSMLNESLFTGIIGTILVPAFGMLIKLHSMSSDLQHRYLGLKLVARKNKHWPRTVRDLETNRRSRHIVRCYYEDSKRLISWAHRGFAGVFLVCFLAISPYVALFAIPKESISLLVIQIFAMISALCLSAWSILKVSQTTRSMDEAELLIQKKSKEKDKNKNKAKKSE